MSSHLTPPPSSPQFYHMNASECCSELPPSSPLCTPRIQKASDGKTDKGTMQLPSTPVPKHVLRRSSSQGTVHVPRSIGKSPLGDHSGDYLAASLPPAIHKLSACAKQAHNKFTPYHKPHGASSIELRFTEKSLDRHPCNDITLEDARKGKALLMRGLRAMSENTFSKALAMKEADRESARLRALMTAWELEAVSHQREFLLAIQEENMQQFLQSADDLQFFMNILECCSVNELKNEEDFQVGTYGQDLTSLALEDEHLSQMEEVSGERVEREAVNSQDDLLAILAAAVNVDALETDGSETSEDEVHL
ncbi:hypothetical protein PISMIDRAFT_17479 [Pisolithus microcarpus 441]|uniref:Uncharacterized protein n=1 Tax=Pisolithus microcarpus 441 TaxID=765257 RepID=A0A0C9Z2D2_9AGAM|nr:hypothetical protein BKA83DRAFT_17479 [Pisolithus microcarpus]KAI6009747.1 hypothetical protein BKA83DRAFT_4504532 [Pisolithus microcarpus]KIK14188.1 hypothetical protein PISMIDRAFT_17479 [Pisolithus microcarpus 441]